MLLKFEKLHDLANEISYNNLFADQHHPHHNIPEFTGSIWRSKDRMIGELRKEIEVNIKENKLSAAEFQSYREKILDKLDEGIEKLKAKRHPEGHRSYELRAGAKDIEFKVWMPSPEGDEKYPTNIANLQDLQHYYEVEMHPVNLARAERIYNEVEDCIDSFMVISDADSSDYTGIYLRQIKGQHLQILCHAIYKYCSEKQLQIEKRQIAEGLQAIFKKSESEHFSNGRILTGSKTKLTKKQMDDVATVLFEIGNLIDAEIKEDPENGYFSKG